MFQIHENSEMVIQHTYRSKLLCVMLYSPAFLEVPVGRLCKCLQKASPLPGDL